LKSLVISGSGAVSLSTAQKWPVELSLPGVQDWFDAVEIQNEKEAA
jgi:hypothetical protein